MMENYSMNDATFKCVLSDYIHKPFFIGMDGDDLADIFDLVHDLLEAECDATKFSAPYAHNSIDRLESARHEVFMMGLDIAEAFEECYPERA